MSLSIKVYFAGGKEGLNWNFFVIGFRSFDFKFTVITGGPGFFELTDLFN